MDVSTQLRELEQKYDLVKVEKNIPLEYDLAYLVAHDINPIEDISKQGILDWTRDGTQLLINQIFALPIESNDDGVFAKLPRKINLLPRAKPIPKPKPPTRWEKFAAAKGIQKRKKVRVQYDENQDEYRPVWGYKNQGKDAKQDLSDWIKEVPVNSDQTTDQYQVDREEKKKRVEKNKMQQQRNLEEAYAAEKGKNHRAFKKMQIEKQIVDTKVSTASMGRFDKKLEGDHTKIKGQKQKFESNTKPAKEEKQKQMAIIEKMDTGDSSLIVRKAVNLVKNEKQKKPHKFKKK